MEKELNIAAILKEKPIYTKLWSPLYGDVFFKRIVTNDGIRVLCKGLDGSFGTDEKSFWKNGKYTLAGEVCLFPSKEMLDWEKFAWKKGILRSYIYMSKDDMIPFENCSFCVSGCLDSLRQATDSEKQLLFDALAKEGKRWNPDTLQIEDLPKKFEFKTMDWCLIQVERGDVWHLAQYASKYENRYYFVGGMNVYITKEIIVLPYNDQTAHLLGTTDDWKGGEG